VAAVTAAASRARSGGPAVALLGCGRWGRHILRDLVALGAGVVVVDPAPAARAAAESLGAVAVADAALLPAVAGAVVATPTVLHAAAVEALLPRGIPIFCEKPLTADAATARRLTTAAADRLFVMDKWRYHPGIACLRDIARSGELGPVRALETVRHGWVHAHADVDAIWILAPHDLSIALEILGALPAVYAATGTRAGAGGARLVGTLGSDPRVRIDVGSVTPTRRQVRLRCAHGDAVLDDAYSDHVTVTRSGAPPEHRVIGLDPPLRRELHAFLAHLAGGPSPKSSGADGALIVETIERLRLLAGLHGVPA
jgi:predicted dehydrogenase